MATAQSLLHLILWLSKPLALSWHPMVPAAAACVLAVPWSRMLSSKQVA